MESLKKICFWSLPRRVETALAEQLARGILPTVPEVVPGPAAADIVIAGGALPLPLPGVPVITLSPGRKLRLGALLRQVRQMLEEPALYLEPFALGDYIFHPQEKQLTDQGDGVIDLTDKEVEILVYLARHRLASREDLLKNVWRYQDGVDTHTLETHIYRLRQKIEASADHPQLLVTDEQGYRLNI